MKRKIRVTSLEAFNEIVPTLGERQLFVLKGLRKLNRPVSNLMLSRYLHIPINQCVPRIYELRKMGIVVMAKKDIDPITGKRVIYWQIKKWIQEIMN